LLMVCVKIGLSVCPSDNCLVRVAVRAPGVGGHIRDGRSRVV
jgi:hypothetical protein